jgi:acyl-CoA reductase-like NAD-dependent aldehyde dehydrogenase
MGPVQNSMQYNKLKGMFSEIANQGWKASIRGGVPSNTKGYFIDAAIIDNPPDSSRIVVEEQFGPIIPLLKWSNEDEVIRRANDTKYGLGASVWTRDFEQGERIAKQLEAGSVYVNGHAEVPTANTPFGGHKWSGMGMEWGIEGLNAWCNPQVMWLPKVKS